MVVSNSVNVHNQVSLPTAIHIIHVLTNVNDESTQWQSQYWVKGFMLTHISPSPPKQATAEIYELKNILPKMHNISLQ